MTLVNMSSNGAFSTSAAHQNPTHPFEEIKTIFVIGFPDDIHEREFQNIFTFCAGFEAATLKIPTTVAEDDGRKQIIGFAKFRSRSDALEARDILTGKKIDHEKGCVLKAEMAKKNLHLKRTGGGVCSSDYANLYHLTYSPAQSSNRNLSFSTMSRSSESLSSDPYNYYAAFPPYSQPTHFYADAPSADGNFDHFNNPTIFPMFNSNTNNFIDTKHDSETVNERTRSLSERNSSNPYCDSSHSRSLGSFSADLLSKSSLSDLIDNGPFSAANSTVSMLRSSSDLTLHGIEKLGCGMEHNFLPGHMSHSSTDLESTHHNNFDAHFSNLCLSTSIASSRANSVSMPLAPGAPLRPLSSDHSNPPCNTLYVGNLPMLASEDELRSIFSLAPGCKRLCYRAKSNGPMCFVEFESVELANQAMQDFYGYHLSNATKGGMRLSYSKNPLGVRSHGHQNYKDSSNTSHFYPMKTEDERLHL